VSWWKGYALLWFSLLMGDEMPHGEVRGDWSVRAAVAGAGMTAQIQRRATARASRPPTFQNDLHYRTVLFRLTSIGI
jgi:hypothetical protein